MLEKYIDDSAVVLTSSIGQGTRIWQYTVILSNAKIGSDCNICSHVFIENQVIIGNRVTIKAGVQLWDGINLEDDVFVGPNVSFSNDKFPRSKNRENLLLETNVRKGASISAGAIILPGLEIGENAMIGAGAVVTENVPANAIVKGNPARISGYVNSDDISSVDKNNIYANTKSSSKIIVKDIKLIKLKIFSDIRGNLSVANINEEIPFLPKRYFMIYGVPSKETRGEYALKSTKQFIVCARGSCTIMVDDGINRQDVTLNSPEYGLFIPPMTWGTQYKYSDDALLCVFASEDYSNGEYIRKYSEFKRIIQ